MGAAHDPETVEDPSDARIRDHHHLDRHVRRHCRRGHESHPSAQLMARTGRPDAEPRAPQSGRVKMPAHSAEEPSVPPAAGASELPV
jgi:hypothetical protein